MHAVGQTEVEYTDLPIYRSQLASELGFDENDIASNRAGRLGDGPQRRTLDRRLRNEVLGTLGLPRNQNALDVSVDVLLDRRRPTVCRWQGLGSARVGP